MAKCSGPLKNDAASYCACIDEAEQELRTGTRPELREYLRTVAEKFEADSGFSARKQKDFTMAIAGNAQDDHEK